MLALLYYVFVWPFRVLGGGLLDDVLVMVGFKYNVPIGAPVWHRRPIRDWWKRHQQRRAHRPTFARATIIRRRR